MVKKYFDCYGFGWGNLFMIGGFAAGQPGAAGNIIIYYFILYPVPDPFMIIIKYHLGDYLNNTYPR